MMQASAIFALAAFALSSTAASQSSADTGSAVLCNQGSKAIRAAISFSEPGAVERLKWSAIPSDRCIAIEIADRSIDFDVMLWSPATGFVGLGELDEPLAKPDAHRCVALPPEIKEVEQAASRLPDRCLAMGIAVPVSSRISLVRRATYIGIVNLDDEKRERHSVGY